MVPRDSSTDAVDAVLDDLLDDISAGSRLSHSAAAAQPPSEPPCTQAQPPPSPAPDALPARGSGGDQAAAVGPGRTVTRVSAPPRASAAAVRVFCRVRPAPGTLQDNGLAIDADATTLTVTHRARRDGAFGAAASSLNAGTTAAPTERRPFAFARVLGPSATQADVFASCAGDAVAALLDGYHACVMTYGQTGAGKTYTMTGGGGGGAYASRGLVPRALAAVFDALNARPDGGASATVRVGFVELYNEQWGDLLRAATPPGSLHVTEVVNPSGGPDVVTLRAQTWRSCTCEEDALEALFEGERTRAVGEHAMNRASSRSHAIFTVSLEQREPAAAAAGGGGDDDTQAVASSDVTPSRVVHSKLHLVDLAGSERLLKTRSEGQVAHEARHINKSLSFLEQTVLALSEQAGHVPYRSSKLTHLLKEALGGNCKTTFIANVWGSRDQADETLSTCRFAARMACVSGTPRRNVVEDPVVTIARLRRTITSLRAQLLAATGSDGGGGGGDAAGDDGGRVLLAEAAALAVPEAAAAAEAAAPVDEAGIEERLRAFLAHPEDDVIAVEPAHVLGAACTPAAAFALNSVRRMWVTSRHCIATAAAAVQLSERSSADGAPEVAQPAGMVLSVEPVAPPSAAPPSEPPPEEEPPAPPPVPPQAPPMAVIVDEAAARDAAFERYKAGPGQHAAALLAHNKAALKDAKRSAKALAERCNAAKADIDALRAAGDAASDDEELRKTRLAAAKKAYKSAHDELLMVRSDADYASSLVEACARDLVAGFETWLTQERERDEAAQVAAIPATTNTPVQSARTASPVKGRATSPFGRKAPAPVVASPPAQSAAPLDPEEAAYLNVIRRAHARAAAAAASAPPGVGLATVAARTRALTATVR